MSRRVGNPPRFEPESAGILDVVPAGSPRASWAMRAVTLLPFFDYVISVLAADVKSPFLG